MILTQGTLAAIRGKKKKTLAAILYPELRSRKLAGVSCLLMIAAAVKCCSSFVI
jgi:hypothetical protein